MTTYEPAVIPGLTINEDGSLINWLGENYVRQQESIDLAEALRLTQEYVGPETLPAVAGWSWFDALSKYHPDLLPVVTPPEPNGLGAVVKGTTADGSGATWVRAIRNGGPAVWALSIPDTAGRERWWLWSAMRVTEVVSHGVGCTCGGPGCPGGDA